MYEVSDQAALDAMQRYGGSFASNLAKAWMHADNDNRLKLATAFRSLLEHYRRLAVKLADNREQSDA